MRTRSSVVPTVLARPFRVTGLAGALAVASVGLSGPASAAGTVEVATFSELQTALGPGCSTGDTVKVTASIVEGTGSQSTVSCDVTLDLNGQHVQEAAGKPLAVVDDKSRWV